MKTKLALLFTFLLSFTNESFSQNDNVIEQTFHESGKINVVVAVVLVIFIGIIFFLVKQERKIAKIEKELDK